MLQIQALKADEDVVNCVQPHPCLPLLATSGIESVVKLWAPGESTEGYRLKNPLNSLISYNQERLKSQTNLFSSVTPRVMAVRFISMYQGSIVSYAPKAECRAMQTVKISAMECAVIRLSQLCLISEYQRTFSTVLSTIVQHCTIVSCFERVLQDQYKVIAGQLVTMSTH